MTNNAELLGLQQFYAGQKIFVTGSTGFLGRVLVEKLLRSCRDIDTIYLLVRSKRGKDVQDRLDALFQDPFFDLLKEEFPGFREKIVGIEGDIAQRGLGLSEQHRARIANEVGLIFNVAASIRFNQEIEEAVTNNVNSVKGIVDLARECKQLRAVVHVSTAYSNCNRNQIGEKLYPSPLSYKEVNDIVDIAKNNKWSTEMMRSITKSLLGDWPNTYVFTKAIGESVVDKYARDLPFGVFRPSIVSGCYAEPIPGWSTNLVGLNSGFVGIGTGIVKVVRADPNVVVDLCPADMSCNAMIACAWDIADRYKRNPEDIPIYNFVTGVQNPVTWREMYHLATTYGIKWATDFAVWHTAAITTKSETLFQVLNFFFHLIPAILADKVGKLFGKEPKFYNLYERMIKSADSVTFFALHDWQFEDNQVRGLWARLSPNDKQIFPFDVRKIIWKDCCMDALHGVRKYILLDPDETLERARRKHVVLWFIHYAVVITFAVISLWIIWKLVTWWC